MGLQEFTDMDGWSNVCLMVFFFALGGILMWLANPNRKDPESFKKVYRGFGIFCFVIAGINTILVFGKGVAAAYAEPSQPQVMNAVIPNGNGKNPIVRLGNNGEKEVFYNAPLPIPTRGELLEMEAAPQPTRANLLRQQAKKIPNTPVA